MDFFEFFEDSESDGGDPDSDEHQEADPMGQAPSLAPSQQQQQEQERSALLLPPRRHALQDACRAMPNVQDGHGGRRESVPSDTALFDDVLRAVLLLPAKPRETANDDSEISAAGSIHAKPSAGGSCNENSDRDSGDGHDVASATGAVAQVPASPATPTTRTTSCEDKSVCSVLTRLLSADCCPTNTVHDAEASSVGASGSRKGGGIAGHDGVFGGGAVRGITKARENAAFTSANDELSSLVAEDAPRRVCQYAFRRNDIVWICKACQADETCVLCNDCFRGSDHTGHEVYFYHAKVTKQICTVAVTTVFSTAVHRVPAVVQLDTV